MLKYPALPVITCKFFKICHSFSLAHKMVAEISGIACDNFKIKTLNVVIDGQKFKYWIIWCSLGLSCVARCSQAIIPFTTPMNSFCFISFSGSFLMSSQISKTMTTTRAQENLNQLRGCPREAVKRWNPMIWVWIWFRFKWFFPKLTYRKSF